MVDDLRRLGNEKTDALEFTKLLVTKMSNAPNKFKLGPCDPLIISKIEKYPEIDKDLLTSSNT